MLDREKWEQYGMPRTEPIKGITIHNTCNNMTAAELEEYMANSKRHYATHYFVDDKEVIQVMPTDWCVWHTGKGYDMGNMRTIAIEVSMSMADIDTYMKAQGNAIKLIKELLKEHHLKKSDVFFHSNFQNVYCPHRILDIYKTRNKFIQEVL